MYLDCADAPARPRSSGQALAISSAAPGARHLDQLHVRDVEQAGMLAGMQMLLHDAGRIGKRHRPAGKGAETRAGGDDARSSRGSVSGRRRSLLLQSARIRPLSRPFVPLCLKPERLAQPELCRRRLHLRRGIVDPDFPECPYPLTVLLPERFRAISPSAAASLLSPANRWGRTPDESDASPCAGLCHHPSARGWRPDRPKAFANPAPYRFLKTVLLTWRHVKEGGPDASRSKNGDDPWAN